MTKKRVRSSALKTRAGMLGGDSMTEGTRKSTRFLAVLSWPGGQRIWASKGTLEEAKELTELDPGPRSTWELWRIDVTTKSTRLPPE